jgi:hypothetical protein
MWRHRTLTGRVVYERPKHSFGVKDALRVTRSLQVEDLERGSFTENLVAAFDLQNETQEFWANFGVSALGFDPEGVFQNLVDRILRLREVERRKVLEYGRLLERFGGIENRNPSQSFGRQVAASLASRSAIGGFELGRNFALQVRQHYLDLADLISTTF